MQGFLELQWNGRLLWPLLLKLALLALAIGAARARGRASASPWRETLALAVALLGVNLCFDLLSVGLSFNAAPHGRGAVAPLFAYFAPRFAWPAVLHAALAAAAIAASPRWLAPERTSPRAFALGLYGAALAGPPLLAFSSPPSEVFQQFFRSGLDYPRDVPPLANAIALLRSHVASMPELSIHARTHGPGALLTLSAIRSLVGSGELAQALALQALGALLPLATWAFARGLQGERAARLAAGLLALSPSFQLFSFVSMDGVFALWLFALFALGFAALYRSGASRRSAWLAGGIGYAAALHSFSASVVALQLGFAALRGLRTRALAWRQLAAVAWRAAAAALACHALLRASTGFDLVACFRAALRENDALIEPAWASLESAGLRALGNAAAFAFACGIPVSALALAALAARRRDPSPLAQLGSATALAIGATLLLGLYQWEVERIWLFLVPAVSASAAGLLASHEPATQRRVLGLVWLQSFATELALHTWW